MTPRTKQIAILFLIAALAAVMLLSVSLSGLELKPGLPFPGGGQEGNAGAAATPLTRIEPGRWPLLEVILGILLLAFVVYVPARLVAFVRIKNILKVAAACLLLLALISILPRVEPGPPSLVPNEPVQPQPPPTRSYPVTPLGKPPVEFLWLTAGGILVGVGLLAADLVRRKRKPAEAADALLQHAEDALDALRLGDSFSDVIVRCYLQMTEVLKAERKIERNRSMTVREFEEWLEYKGIPAAPVRGLTGLFEKARYSQEQIDDADEKKGTECLRQIVQYCRGETG